MPSFKKVYSSFDIRVSDDYFDATTFNSFDKIKTYKGREYKLISKKERDFSFMERAGRGFLGTVAVICSLGLALFSKSVRKLFVKDKKAIRFGVLQNKNTQDLVKYLKGETLRTDKELIKQLCADYSSHNGQIKIDNRIVDMGTPAFAENRGTGVIYPTSLTDMFPEEIKTYFGETFEDMAPTLALLLQQGIAAELLVRANESNKDSNLMMMPLTGDTWPHFEFSKNENEISLSITLNLQLLDMTDPGKASDTFETINYVINLTNKDAPIKITFKD